MHKLVIFDLDGTLVNSLDDLGNACNKALEMFGFPPHPMDSYRYFVGNGVPMLIRRALPESTRTEECTAKVKKEFDRIYGSAYNVCTRPYEGIADTLEKLSANGVLTAVLSNKPDNFTKAIISDMFGENTFNLVAGKKDGVPPKPDPAAALSIMESLGVLPLKTLFAGDSAVDMQTAKNAGCRSIGCTWGFRPLSELLENNADYIADTPEQILKTALEN